MALDHVGLNHLTWTRRVLVDEQDRLPELLATSAEALARRSGLPADKAAGGVASYYLRHFYEHDHVVEQQRSQPSRAQEVAEIESQLLEIYANPAVDEKPALLQQRGGAYYSEAAVDLMASLITDRGDVQVVNLRNHGTLAFLADQVVIEVPARVRARPATADAATSRAAPRWPHCPRLGVRGAGAGRCYPRWAGAGVPRLAGSPAHRATRLPTS